MAKAAYPLVTIPAGSQALGVTAHLGHMAGRDGLCLTLDAARRAGVAGVDYVDQPTFLLLPDLFQDGVIEVDVLGRLLPDAPDYARGFAGLAYRVQEGAATFGAAYLRPTNGRGLAPNPRAERAVQVFAYPDWPFDILREKHPGRFEAGAPIAPGRWHHLRLDLSGPSVAVAVDGEEILRLADGFAPGAPGRVGLWVDIGTEGWFANLRMAPGRQ